MHLEPLMYVQIALRGHLPFQAEFMPRGKRLMNPLQIDVTDSYQETSSAEFMNG
jgi:hypothetical protein